MVLNSRHCLSKAGLFLLACTLLLTGCMSAEPETWEQATTRTYRVPVQQQLQAYQQGLALGLEPGQAPVPLPTRPVWDAQADQYDWRKGYKQGDYARAGEGFDLAMRNPDFPQTYISEVHVSLNSPDHIVYIVWAGPHAASAPAGPWRSSPGRGTGDYQCNDESDSNTENSNCTPKGVFVSKGF